MKDVAKRKRKGWREAPSIRVQVRPQVAMVVPVLRRARSSPASPLERVRDGRAVAKNTVAISDIWSK